MPPYAKKEKGRDYCCVDREQESGRDTWIAIKAEPFASDAAMAWQAQATTADSGGVAQNRQ